MEAYNNPGQTLLDPKRHQGVTESDWVMWLWVMRYDFVRSKGVDLAIELIEDYDPNRVIGAIAVALGIFFALTIAWLIKGGDPGYVAGVMSFVLSILAGKHSFTYTLLTTMDGD
jgi:hypothetical protein